jgi:hypothetical protein
MKFRGWTTFLFVLVAVSLVLTGGCIRRAPNGAPTAPGSAVPDPATLAPPQPEMRLVKVSGAGKADMFSARLVWTGKDPEPWTVKRWTLMHDKTGQTQSMIVIEEQTFSIKPGETRTVQVKSVPLDPSKPPARHLIVEYEGMPVYELTRQTADAKVNQFIQGVERFENDLTGMMAKVKFVGQSIEYAPADRAAVEPFLEIIVWDLSGDTPEPYIEQPVIEAALVTAMAGGMSLADFATFLQRKVAGLSVKDAAGEARRLRPRVNALLEYAGFAARLG